MQLLGTEKSRIRESDNSVKKCQIGNSEWRNKKMRFISRALLRTKSLTRPNKLVCFDDPLCWRLLWRQRRSIGLCFAYEIGIKIQHPDSICYTYSRKKKKKKFVKGYSLR